MKTPDDKNVVGMTYFRKAAENSMGLKRCVFRTEWFNELSF